MMYRFYFNNTSYIVIDIIQSKFYYLNQDNKYKFTFYDSMIEKASIIFNNIQELTTFLCKLRYFIDGLSRDKYDTNYLYISNTNEYGNYIQILSNYIPTLHDNPSDEDDYIQFYITSCNDMYHRYSIIYSVTVQNITLDSLSEYIISILESMNIDIIPYTESIFSDLIYGDFNRYEI